MIMAPRAPRSSPAPASASTSPSPSESDGEEPTSVLYVLRRDAKSVKSKLEEASLLDRRHRIAPAASSAGGVASSPPFPTPDSSRATPSLDGCVAIPVAAEGWELFRRFSEGDDEGDEGEGGRWLDLIVARGMQVCPLSTAALGNRKNRRLRPRAGSSDAGAPLSDVQRALVDTLCDWLESNGACDDGRSIEARIEGSVRGLSARTCPKKLEIVGDDRTLVIPRWALLVNSGRGEGDCASPEFASKKGSDEYRDLLLAVIREAGRGANGEDRGVSDPNRPAHRVDCHAAAIRNLQSRLWRDLSLLFDCPRVVRRGDVDPDSGVRESGHRILWPKPDDRPDGESTGEPEGDFDRGFLPATTGPGTPGWIVVTEHGIRQSFDLTRVMFSRGNVTEKRRFGSLVQPGERVLDMYAGIGYYALPALISGKARHVVACEWNPRAVRALRHNLKDNGVEDRATALEGDCRACLREYARHDDDDDNDDDDSGSGNTENNGDGNGNNGRLAPEERHFDRISLGLLPSSEGGWPTAASCLRPDVGGWLHVHGNVPATERADWTHWVCRRLADIAKEQRRGRRHGRDDGWIAVCVRVERVKSFAPKIDHLVADVFVGPSDSPKFPDLPLRSSAGGAGRSSCKESTTTTTSRTTGTVDEGARTFVATPARVAPPSCALGEGGVLRQRWMRE
ncbi:hypothetical protein ACHAWF_018081 [Thalassiosira exigua]